MAGLATGFMLGRLSGNGEADNRRMLDLASGMAHGFRMLPASPPPMDPHLSQALAQLRQMEIEMAVLRQQCDVNYQAFTDEQAKRKRLETDNGLLEQILSWGSPPHP